MEQVILPTGNSKIYQDIIKYPSDILNTWEESKSPLCKDINQFRDLLNFIYKQKRLFDSISVL